MSAAACLQVVISPAFKVSDNFNLLNTVGKVTGAYLESRWSWPRKFAPISKTSYMLADPYAAALDPHEIKQLSAELQLRLFGVGEAGEVALAMFEGSSEDSVRFSRLQMDDMRRLLNGAGLETVGLSGRLVKVSARSVEVVVDASGTHDSDLCDAPEAQNAQPQTQLLYRGLYLAPKQQFVGNVLSRWSPEDKRLQSVIEGPSHYPSDPETFDRETLEALIRTFPDPSSISGHIMLPLNYTALSRRTSREHYAEFLRPLAKWPSEFLTAKLYDAPRMVQHNALKEIKALLGVYFGAVDLCVADAGVALEMFEPSALRSVSLSLSSADEDMQREAAIRRFMSNRDLFREKHIWPVIGNVRTRREVLICAAVKAPFMYGPAITGILTQPLGMLPFLTEGLPLNAKAAA